MWSPREKDNEKGDSGRQRIKIQGRSAGFFNTLIFLATRTFLGVIFSVDDLMMDFCWRNGNFNDTDPMDRAPSDANGHKRTDEVAKQNGRSNTDSDGRSKGRAQWLSLTVKPVRSTLPIDYLHPECKSAVYDHQTERRMNGISPFFVLVVGKELVELLRLELELVRGVLLHRLLIIDVVVLLWRAKTVEPIVLKSSLIANTSNAISTSRTHDR